VSTSHRREYRVTAAIEWVCEFKSVGRVARSRAGHERVQLSSPSIGTAPNGRGQRELTALYGGLPTRAVALDKMSRAT
jgi:hypothetical protein